MITVSNLTKGFGTRDLFNGADLFIAARDRVAIVGPNGTGKTTLLEMIAGDQAPDVGDVRVMHGAVVGYLEQETDALRGRSVIDEVLTAGAEATKAAHRLELLSEEIAETEPGPDRDALVNEYGKLQHRFESIGGYSIEAEAKRILSGLGFEEKDHERQTDALSGGWLMRVALAKLLLSGPDVLMLDEPTNHLDVNSVEWLEGFLDSYDGCVLLISHDRDFIEGIATRVVEIDAGKLVSYTGGYSDFVEQRALRMEQAAAEAKGRDRKVAETQAFIDRFRYKASKAKQVQSRVKMLERMTDGPQAPSRARKAMGLRFPTPPRSGRDVVVMDDVSFSYGDNPVYEHLGLVIERGQKVALVGPNGAGKSTLLKLAAGVLQPTAGERRLGHNVHLSYFAQHQIEALDPSNRVLEELAKAIPRTVDLRPRDSAWSVPVLR